MFTRNSSLVFGGVGLLLAALPVYAKKIPKVYVQTATIENTGSTNTLGYHFQVSSNGSVTQIYTQNDLPFGSGRLTDPDAVKVKPIALRDAGKFFRDIETAMPLNALPVRHGMRSASFGTRTYITYKGQKSPDLTFASDPRTAALKADIDAITKTLHIGNAPKHPIVIQQSTKPLAEQHFLERF